MRHPDDATLFPDNADYEWALRLRASREHHQAEDFKMWTDGPAETPSSDDAADDDLPF